MNLGQSVLHAARTRGWPVIGVNLRDPVDRQTWAFQYHPSATPEQRAAAEAWKAQFDPVAAQDEEDRHAFDEQRWLKALSIWTADQLGVDRAKARRELMTMYRNL